MTKLSETDTQQSSNSHKRFWLLWLRRTGIYLGIPLVIGLGGGAWWLWVFVQERLAPLVQQNLTQTLNRPVQLGEVEEFSLSGLRFGKSSIPATSSDPDRATIESVDVKFDLLQLLFTRTLQLDVTLINPDVYIEQDAEGRWVSTTIASQEGEGAFRTQLDTIGVINADLVLVSNQQPKSKKQVSLAQVNGSAQFLQDNELVKFNLSGETTTKGNLLVQGEARPQTSTINLQLRGQNILASDVTRLIDLPLEIRSGRADANLRVESRPEQPTLLFGTANIRAVTAKVPQLPQAFNNATGTLLFKETAIGLDNVKASYGKIPAIAKGTLDPQVGYNLIAQVPSVSLATAQNTLNLKLPVAVSGVVRADLKFAGPIKKPILSGNVATIKPARIDRVNFSNVRSQFAFSPVDLALVFNNIQARPAAGGQIAGNGIIKLGETPQLGFTAVAQNIPGDAIARLYNISPQIKIGTVSAKTQVGGAIDNLQTIVNWEAPQATYPGSGQVVINDTNTFTFRDTRLRVGGGTLQAVGQLTGDRFRASVLASNVRLGQVLDTPPALNSPLSGRFDIAGSTNNLNPEAITAVGEGRLNVGGGTITATNIQLNQGRWQTQLQTQNVPIGQLAQVPPQLQGRLTGSFRVAGVTQSFQPETISAVGQGRLNIADGTVNATNIQLNQGRWRSQIQAQGVQIGQLAPQVPPQFRGRLTGSFQVAGNTQSFAPNTISAIGQGRLNVANGTVTATNIQLNRGQWQALVNASELQLDRFSEELRGRLSGQVLVAGNVDNLNLGAIRAAGQVRFSQGVSLITQPLTAAIQWDGEKIIVQQATAPDLVASGLIFVETQNTPSIQALNLNVKAQNYDLQDLPFNLPNAVNLAGRADFAGRISGTLPTPNVVGGLRLRGLVVNNLAFDPVLTGNVQVNDRKGVNLDVTGTGDRIAVNLDSNYRPNSFIVQRDRAIARGQTQGENLLVNVENFPLQTLKLNLPNSPLGRGSVGGLLTGDFTINQNTFAVAGDVAIASPVLGNLKGDRFSGQFSYNAGAITLTDARFDLGDSLYAATGRFTPTPNGPRIQGQLNVTQGKVQDVIAAVQSLNLQNFGGSSEPPTDAGAVALATESVGLPDASLQTQLRRFSEINMLLAMQQRQGQGNMTLPGLEDLAGTFNAQIAVNGSSLDAVAVNFDVTGQDWQIGNDYKASQVVAQGSFVNGILTFEPLRIQSDNSLLAFNGQIGGRQQSGQLQVNNFPIEAIENFVQLPVDVTGNLNAKATLSGTIANPQVEGELSLADGTLNQKAIASALTSFSYNNARLNFDSNIVVDGPEPIAIRGNLPVALPFIAAKPDSNEISLNVNVNDEGLALFNLFTDQVAWQNGEGQVNLQVSGTLNEPIAKGVATVNNATITAQALPEPLTDVTGTVNFNLDRIQVDNLRGNFSQGQVVAQGVIPIFRRLSANDPDLANPLTVNLDQLALNLRGLYRGGASGNVIVTGSALSPAIGGEVLLADGEVLLGERQSASAAASSQVATSLRQGDDTNQFGTGLEFNNLQLTLNDNIAITLPPVLEFEANGSLTLNGSIDDIRPNGTIGLRRGGINLFTTQFVLARGYENKATFTPEGSLDPTLDVRLVARVPEVTRNRVPSSPVSAEISETLLASDLGALRTVRVQARVQGPASQIFDNLELTSDPTRSQNEIIALIGGGFVDTLGRGDSTLGLANLAGSAILGNFQGTVSRIGNALGLDELRLFPTVSNSEESRNSTLGLAAEANIDLSRNLSVSILRILTTNEPTQFGLSYRLDDNLRVRASTNLSAESLAILEYENRF